MTKKKQVKLTPREWALRLGDKYRFWRGAAFSGGIQPTQRITKDVFLSLFENAPSPPEPVLVPEPASKPQAAPKKREAKTKKEE